MDQVLFQPPQPQQTLSGPLFGEPVRVETVELAGVGAWQLGAVGLRTEKFYRVRVTEEQLAQMSVLPAERTFDGDGHLLRLGLQAHVLGLAYEYDPYFGLSLSRVDPLPHQLEAVYDYLLRLPSVRFLLADDAGAGKTVMAGLLLRELKLRGLADRVLIVTPANLTFQWQRELKEKFGEGFLVLKGGDIREQFGVNQWLEQKQILTSLDLAKRAEILPGLRQAHWDLVIVDEAHRMSAPDESRKTHRYRLGELLRDTTDNMLLLTATPHKGDPENFSLFLQLLDPDVYADARSIREAMERRRAPFYLRRTKEAMIYFPSRQADGSWVAEKIFTKRIPHTASFKMDGEEFQLYRDVTRFVQSQCAHAMAREDARGRAVGFLMALYQRRFASSARALRRSLENRAKRLEDGLRNALALAQQAPPDVPDADELEEMEEADRERIERMLEAITLAGNAAEVRSEIGQLTQLAGRAANLEATGTEAKLAKLRETLQDQGFFADPEQRLLIFTEFKDTLDYLLERLTEWGFRVGMIHGGMKPGSREEPGTRLHAEQQFKEGEIQILVATEAAGEGINLQFCHILFNYDIPWNPNRLEQRMGRIHRYGQQHDCLIFNFVAANTIEGRVLLRLLVKLQEIRNALDDDAVFNVVGEILPAAHIERILRDYYAGRLGDQDFEERLLRNVDEQRFRDICQNALEGLASKTLNLEMLLERRATAQERRIVPETIARFLHHAGEMAGLTLKPVAKLPHSFDPARTPIVLQRFSQEPGWRHGILAGRYPRLSTDRKTADEHSLEWVTPGHPLFEAVRRLALDQAEAVFGRGATFFSLQHETPARLDFYRAKVVDGLGQILHERLFVVEVAEGVEPRLREPGVLGDFSPAAAPEALPSRASAPEARDWLDANALAPFLAEIEAERHRELERVAEHVELALRELLFRADQEIGKIQGEAERGDQGAEGRLVAAENRHSELTVRLDRRRRELAQQRALTIQGVERLASALVLPHPEREAPEVRRLRPDPEVEQTAMDVVAAWEREQGRVVDDVHLQNLGYDFRSMDPHSGELRLIEVKGIGAATGTILVTPNELRTAQDRPDCYWLYVVTDCKSDHPRLRPPVKDPARYEWSPITAVDHYLLPLAILEGGMQ